MKSQFDLSIPRYMNFRLSNKYIKKKNESVKLLTTNVPF